MSIQVEGIRSGQGELEEALNLPLSGLSEAIHELQGACGRLRTSLAGVNGDLEQANSSLLDALEVHSQAKDHLEDILASIPSGVIVVNRQGRIVFFNRAAEGITGFSAEDVRGTDYSLTIGRGVPRKQTPLYTLATGSRVDQEEKAIQSASGDRVPVSFSTSLIGGAASIEGAVEIMSDLRRIKALEEEVARARMLAAIGEVAAVVAHEIRNPLGGMKGFASLLERDLSEQPGPLATLKRISEGIESLESIVGDLLDAGRDAKMRFSHAELGSEVKRVAGISEKAARGEGKNIRFKVDVPPEPVYCRVDTDRIRQALTNLIRNAFEAVGQSGAVTVRLSTGKGDGTGPSKRGNDSRDYLFIDVTDTGPGVPKERLAKIFSPFFTTKSGGTGLGLPAVRRAVALHGGEVKYARPEPGGSTFTMVVPRW
jgi:PAS domain S-box-containing protein